MGTYFRMTRATRAVTETLLAMGGRHYVREICDAADVPSGVACPILARMERAGWLTSEWGDVDPENPHRPRRRYYTFTPTGREMALFRLARPSQEKSACLATSAQPSASGVPAAD